MKTIFSSRASKHTGASHEPGICRWCHEQLVSFPTNGAKRRNCSQECRHAIQKHPLEERELLRSSVPFGQCVNCRKPIPEEDLIWKCSKWKKTPELLEMRRLSPGKVRMGEEGYDWLAKKLGLVLGDERLAPIALKLAEQEKLLVIVNSHNMPVGFAKVPVGQIQ